MSPSPRNKTAPKSYKLPKLPFQYSELSISPMSSSVLKSVVDAANRGISTGWQTDVVHVQGAVSELHLAALANVLRNRTEWALRLPFARLTLNGEVLDAAEYTFLYSTSSHQYPIVSTRRVRSLMRKGASLILHCLEHEETIHHLCEGVARLVPRDLIGVQANGYLSPPGSGAFPEHEDPHDFLVLQVAGAKTWTLPQTRIQQLDLSDPLSQTPEIRHDEITMNAGDMLYVPQGYRHKATALSQESLHITIGIKTREDGRSPELFTSPAQQRGILIDQVASRLNTTQSLSVVKSDLDSFACRETAAMRRAIGVDAVDFLLTCCDVRFPRLRVWFQGHEVPPAQFGRAWKYSALSQMPLTDPQQVISFIERGAMACFDHIAVYSPMVREYLSRLGVTARCSRLMLLGRGKFDVRLSGDTYIAVAFGEVITSIGILKPNKLYKVRKGRFAFSSNALSSLLILEYASEVSS
jgi:hypothetical protein